MYTYDAYTNRAFSFSLLINLEVLLRQELPLLLMNIQWESVCLAKKGLLSFSFTTYYSPVKLHATHICQASNQPVSIMSFAQNFSTKRCSNTKYRTFTQGRRRMKLTHSFRSLGYSHETRMKIKRNTQWNIKFRSKKLYKHISRASAHSGQFLLYSETQCEPNQRQHGNDKLTNASAIICAFVRRIRH